MRGTNERPSAEMVVKEAEAQRNPLAALDVAMTKAAPRLAEIVPRHVDPMRVIQLAMSCARRDPKILACTTSSVLIATSQIAALGLEPGTALQQAYLVPRKNRKKIGATWKEVHEATAIIGYRGFVLLAFDSEGIDVQADIVRAGDVFEERGGLSPVLIHSKSEQDEIGEFRGAYAVWELSNGKRRHLWWTRRMLNDHRDRHAPKDFNTKEVTGPWAETPDPMRLKTMVRMASKLWPLSSDRMRAALRVDDAGETGRALPFVPGAKSEAVKALAVSMGAAPESFDGADDYDEGQSEPDQVPASDGAGREQEGGA